MKNYIRKWLEIDVLSGNLNEHFNDLVRLSNRIADLEAEIRMFEGHTAKEGGIKEVVYHICRFLGVRPGREFYQEQTGIVEMVTKRRFWLEKGKKNTKIIEDLTQNHDHH